MKEEKVVPVHYDILNREVAVGDLVAVSHHNTLKIATITKLNNKMVKIKPLRTTGRYAASEYNVYSRECVKVEGPDVTMYLLSH